MRTWTCPRFDELKAADRLPTPPGVALSLLRMTSTEGTSAQQIANVLEADPAMVGRVLKMANSLAAGGGKPVTSARDAVVRLGVHAVSNLALGFWLVSQSSSRACKRFDYTGFWQQSLATASTAKALATRVDDLAPEEAFTCGLLAQVGRLALATVYPEAYAEILARCERDGVELLAHLERERFATDHTEVTVAMLEDWGLPIEYPEAVLFQSVGADQLAADTKVGIMSRVLDLSIRLSNAWTAAPDGRQKLLPDCLARGQKLAIAPKVLLGLGDRAMAEWRQWGQALTVPTPDVLSLADFAPRPVALATTSCAAADDPRGVVQKLGNILVVSQDQNMVQFLSKHLASAEHIVSVASNREEALQKMLEEFPHVLILDGFRAGGEGDALCRHLRQARLGRYLYVLALLDTPDQSGLSAVFDAGADDFLTKPINAAMLGARLRAGSRVIGLQEEAQRDKEEMRHFAMELAVANRRLQHAAYEDALTRLPNRRCALERLSQEWARTTRTGQALSCILIDVDHFKRINDTYGHDVGDLVLQGLSDVIRGTVRTSDLACRLGGEEFVILCPDTDIQGAHQCADRLRTKTAANRVRSTAGEISITLSMGVACRQGGMKLAGELLKKADQAVYLAKQSGRNRVCA